jgi:hypothetical protein
MRDLRKAAEPVEYTGNGTAGPEADVQPTGFLFQMPKREWQELNVNEVIQVINENITDPSPELLQELYGLVASVDIWLQEKNSG